MISLKKINMDSIHIGIVIIIGFIIIYVYRKLTKKNKHSQFIKKGKQILKTINKLEHSGQKINYLKKINPYVFEELLLSAFKNKGFKIKRNKKYSGDGGIDGKVYNDQGLFLIQAKRYKDYIRKNQIDEFKIAIIKNMAIGGYFIHTGKTSPELMSYSKDREIEIISGNKLIDLLNNKI
jgi:restriction system protein